MKPSYAASQSYTGHPHAGSNLARLIFWITMLAIFAMAARISVDSDTWWHLRAGQWIVENRSILQIDRFSYTRLGAPWQYPGWLVEVPMYLIYRAFGPGGLNVWTALMVVASFASLWQALSGGPFLRAFALILGATASAVYWAARPYLVTFLFSALFLWILEDVRWRTSQRSIRRLYALPVVMLLWANSHGGFAVGFLLWGVYFTGLLFRYGLSFLSDNKPPDRKELGRMLLVGILLGVAVCVNPAGPGLLAYPFKTVNMGALKDFIQEWQSPDFHALSVQPFLWLLLATIAAVGASKKRLALTDFLLFAGFTYLSLLARRNIALFSLVAPIILTRHAQAVLCALPQLRRTNFDSSFPSRLQRIMNVAILGILWLGVLAKLSLIYPLSVNAGYFQESFPVDAVTYLRQEQPAGRLFNSYNWGGYLIYFLPEYPVFIDGRTDLYDGAVMQQWVQVMRGQEGWQAILDRYDARTILVETDAPLLETLEHSPQWRLAYRDALAVIYQRAGDIQGQ
jgi:hypothetical protein